MLANIVPIVKSFIITNKAMILGFFSIILPKIKSILGSSYEKMKGNKKTTIMILCCICLFISNCNRGNEIDSLEIKISKIEKDLLNQIESNKKQKKQEDINNDIQGNFDREKKAIEKGVVYDNRNLTNDHKKLNDKINIRIKNINNLGK